MSKRAILGQGLRFLTIGAGASLLYFVLALTFDRLASFPPVVASTVAYAFAAVFSYIGHKNFTFNTGTFNIGGRSNFEILRFAVSTLTGFLLASIIPLVLIEYPPVISYLVVLAVVPLLSFLMLKFFVFTKSDP